MIDRDARNQLAEQIRHLVSGQISNDEFESLVPRSGDAAVWEIFWNGAWGLYDDLHEHKLRGSYRIDKKFRADVARWVLFLKSDLEYEWPPFPPKPRMLHILLSIASMGAYIRHKVRQWQQRGDAEVWPFIRKSDYESALTNHPYLRTVQNNTSRRT